MANCYKDKSGWRLVFTDHNRLRRTLRMGSMPRRDMEAIGRRVERLVDSRISGEPPDPETAHWLAKIGSKLRDKLVALSLCEPVEAKARVTLGAFLTAYIDGRAKVKPGTRVNMEAAADALTQFFGSDKPVDAITAGDAEDWSQWLRGGRKLGENTSRRHSGRAKQFFVHAVKKQIIPANPFSDLASRVHPSKKEREHFVTVEQAKAILDACPDAEWRMLFTLARWGGVRIPSEVRNMRWEDLFATKLDDATGEQIPIVRVYSPKTEAHAGKDQREFPLWPQIEAARNELYELASEGAESEYVFPRLRRLSANLRTQMHRIMRRAGVTPFPKCFHNCRATRVTELLQKGYPTHNVVEWMGHSVAISMTHYVRTQASDFRDALAAEQKEHAAAGTNLAHNVQQQRETNRNPVGTVVTKTPLIRGNFGQFPSVTCTAVPPRGDEQQGDSSENIGFSPERGNAGGNDDETEQILALLDAAVTADPQVLDLLRAWPELAIGDRARILELCGVTR